MIRVECGPWLRSVTHHYENGAKVISSEGPVRVKLPPKYNLTNTGGAVLLGMYGGYNAAITDCIAALKAAGVEVCE